jgi:hypothetical protein
MCVCVCVCVCVFIVTHTASCILILLGILSVSVSSSDKEGSLTDRYTRSATSLSDARLYTPGGRLMITDRQKGERKGEKGGR